MHLIQNHYMTATAFNHKATVTR